jgi:hypothetical protein
MQCLWNQADISYTADYLEEVTQDIYESSILCYQIKQDSPISVDHTPVVCAPFQGIASSVYHAACFVPN